MALSKTVDSGWKPPWEANDNIVLYKLGALAKAMDATKALLRHNILPNLETALVSETHLLMQHWASDECQANFKLYTDATPADTVPVDAAPADASEPTVPPADASASQPPPPQAPAD